MQSVIKKLLIKRLVHIEEMQISEKAMAALDKEITDKIYTGIERARLNKRRTVYPRDL